MQFFVASTGQNIGKTTTCLGLIAGLKKRFKQVGYLKPVGQEYIETETGAHVDKDVPLFSSYFALLDSYEHMSPVLFPKRFTRDYLDGKVDTNDLIQKIKHAYQAISSHYPVTVIEGTGHTGVGSIVGLNNAQVASLLGVPMILIASGGLGSSFDELELNRTQCEKHGVRLIGVILNRVLDEKRAMIQEYMNKALRRWNVPLLGCIPYVPFLSTPTMHDFEGLFQTKLMSGEAFRWRHFHDIRLVASSLEAFRTVVVPKQLIITPAGREDIILATLTHVLDLKISHPEEDLETGLILTGKEPPKKLLMEQIQKAEIPMIYAPVSSFIALKMINSHTTKIRKEDRAKIQEAISTVESHLDFERLCSLKQG
jgi:phosphate acetyltransferase